MSNKTMLAARIHDYGDANQIKVESVERPEPKAPEVLVQIKAAGVNPADWKMREGYFKQFLPLPMPWIPGMEAAGIVKAVGSEVKSRQVGDRVYGTFGNSYAEYVVVPENETFLMPEQISFEQAAAVPVGALTAWQAVVEEAEVKPGQRVLVQGGAGGVGVYAVQLAKWKGAHVTATTSTANVDYVRSLGADKVIDYLTTSFEDVVKEVDVVIDTVGGELVKRSMHVIKDGGIFVTVAARVDPEMGAAHNVRATSARRADSNKLEQISDLLASKKLKAETGQVFLLAQAKQAQEKSQTGHGRGRIVLKTA